MRIFKVRVVKTKYNYYTINSDIEGADVIFDGEQIGVIENGKFICKIEEKTDTGSHTVKVENGTLVNKDTIYYLSAKTTLTIPAAGGRYNFNTDNINSTKVTYTPSYPAQTTIEANTAVNLNTVQTPTNSNVGFTPTYYDIAKNDTLAAKDHSVELIQDESNKKVTVTIKQEANVNVNYIVNSDIEGAEVQFSIDNSDFTPVGNITSGTLNFNILQTDTASTVYIKLVGGTLPETKETYIFEAEDIDISAEAWSGKPTITSSKGMTTYSIPAVKTLNNNVTTTTINAVSNQQDGVTVGYTPNDTISIEENKTTNAKQYTYDYTQNESGKTLRITIRQAAGVQYQYTVNYNVPGSTVLADGENVGTISNGSCTFVKWNSGAKASYAISFTGGQMPASPATTYAFSVSPTSLSFSDKGETKSVTVTSTKTVYTNIHNTGTVRKGQAVTLRYKTNNQVTNPTYTRSNSGTGLSGTGTSIRFAANPNKVQRSGSVTFTQSESNKTATVNCTQAAKVAYAYTVNSNCNGGSVYFNGTYKGTISGGTLSFEDDAASGTVSISGGVPSNSSSYVTSETRTNGQDSESDTTTDSETVFKWNNWTWDYLESPGMDFIQAGETNIWPLYSHVKSRTGTRYRYRDIYESRDQYRDTTYSAPSNKTAYGDSSAVTMNYTSSTSTRWTSWSFDHYGSWGSWGSWSYGSYSYSRKNVTITESLSWMTISKSTSGSSGTTGYNISFNATENTGSDRSGYITFSNGINSYKVLVTQVGIEYVFKAEGLFSNADARAGNASSMNKDRDAILSGGIISYKRIGNTYTRLGISIKSKDSQIIDYYASGGSSTGSNAGWDTFTIGFKESPYCSSRTGGANGIHNYSITLQQAESGKTLTLSPNQNDYHVNLGSEGKDTDSKIVPWNSTNSSSNDYTFYLNATTGKGNTSVLANVSSIDFSCSVNGSSMKTINHGEFVNFRFTSNNNSFSERKGQLFLAVGEKTIYNVCTVTLTQQAAPNEFTINLSAYSGKNVAISRSNVTSLITTSTVPTVTVSSSTKINGVLTTNNSNTVAAPFTSYTSQSFKVWTRSGTSGSWSLAKTVTVSPGGTC